jgi:hypothetical protein
VTGSCLTFWINCGNLHAQGNAQWAVSAMRGVPAVFLGIGMAHQQRIPAMAPRPINGTRRPPSSHTCVAPSSTGTGRGNFRRCMCSKLLTTAIPGGNHCQGMARNSTACQITFPPPRHIRTRNFSTTTTHTIEATRNAQNESSS